jgi:hypothetical protein
MILSIVKDTKNRKSVMLCPCQSCDGNKNYSWEGVAMYTPKLNLFLTHFGNPYLNSTKKHNTLDDNMMLKYTPFLSENWQFIKVFKTIVYQKNLTVWWKNGDRWRAMVAWSLTLRNNHLWFHKVLKTPQKTVFTLRYSSRVKHEQGKAQ